jgi:hypothetical protein
MVLCCTSSTPGCLALRRLERCDRARPGGLVHCALPVSIGGVSTVQGSGLKRKPALYRLFSVYSCSSSADHGMWAPTPSRVRPSSGADTGAGAGTSSPTAPLGTSSVTSPLSGVPASPSGVGAAPLDEHDFLAGIELPAGTEVPPHSLNPLYTPRICLPSVPFDILTRRLVSLTRDQVCGTILALRVFRDTVAFVPAPKGTDQHADLPIPAAHDVQCCFGD